jgi:polyhydroxyalkanoate synthase subunit PhaC
MTDNRSDVAASAYDFSELSDEATESVTGQNRVGDLRLSDLIDTAAKLFERAVSQPRAVMEESTRFAEEVRKVFTGQANWTHPLGDKRFTDSSWSENTFYRNLLQVYVAWSQSLQNYAEKAGLDPKEAGRAKFLLSQVSDAFAPTNFLLGNPTALKAAIVSGGKTLLDGYQNFLKDAAERRPVPSQVDTKPFKVGENLAVTPGDVVMRHEMFELLQYAPQTEHVHQRPILVIPSIINKYYAFDLAPGRSLVEYLVKSGFTLFIMVHRNPKPEHDHWGMEAYMDAMGAAIEAVEEISGVGDPHVIAICGAAPLAVSLAGYYAARGESKIGSMTLFVAPLDSSGTANTPGIGDFMDPKLSKLTEQLPARNDRISADEFLLLFAMLRPNDLIWNYWVNNYLMGKQPAAFDVLYWNADGTSMTAQFNRDLRKFSEENPLVKPGAMKVKGTPIADISQFDFDSYVIGARTDHICIWPTVYRSAQMLGDRSRFILGGSGHIQTLVCPPGSPKAFYYTNPDKSGAPEKWLQEAERTQGSWWDHFVAWCSERSGPMVPAPSSPGSKRHPSLGKAPGAYVLEKGS